MATPLTERWAVRHIATHRDGSKGTKIIAFVCGAVAFVRVLAHRPRLVHLHSASYGSFVRKAALAWMGTGAQVPVVLHIHGGEFHLFHDRSSRPVRWIIRRTLERVTVVVALGGRWAGRLSEIAPRARVVVIPNAVRSRDAVRQPAAGEPLHVVFLGDVRDAKGVFTLIEAWGKVAVGRPLGWGRLTIAGAGETERAAALASEIGVDNSVAVLGWIAPLEVPVLLRSAHVLALPSLAEGQPMVVLEAMANGLCVVASDVGGIPDLVDETCGVLIPPGDAEVLAGALTRVTDDAEGRAALGAAALERVRRDFDVDVVWRRVDALYSEVTR